MNVLTTAASGSILFDSGTAGGSTHTHLSAAAELSYDGAGGIDITSHVPGQSDRFNIKGDSSTFFSVKGSGNVGIGTTSPGQKLDVAGNIGVTGCVDGRDLAADGAKLDGICCGAGAGTGTVTNVAGCDGITVNNGTGSACVCVDSTVVRTTGNQSIAGTKNFSGDICVGSKIIHTGDSDTYFQLGNNVAYIVAGNETVLAANASEVVINEPGNSNDFRVESDNNTHALFVDGSADKVGIGTNSPAKKLHVSTGNTDVAARFENTTTNGTVIEVATSGDNRTLHIQTDHICSNGALHLGGDSYHTYIRGSRVGIGTTSPSNKLDVAGNTRICGSLTVGACNKRTVISNDGSGTFIGGAVSNQYLCVGGSSSVFTAQTYQINNNGSPSYFRWCDGSNELMKIVEGGNVGIGCGSPTQKLAVAGDGLFTSDLTVQGDLTVTGDFTCLETTVSLTSAMDITNTGTGPALVVNQTGSNDIVNFQDDGTSAFYIEDGGNVGIGITNPTTKLHVDGTGKFNDSLYFASRGVISWGNIGGGTGFGIRGESGNGLSLGSNGVWDKMVITTSGNVGIGCTNPTVALDIAGYVKATNANVTGSYEMDGTNIINSGRCFVGVQVRPTTSIADAYIASAACWNACATSTQGTTADNALPKAGGTMSGDIVLGSNYIDFKTGGNSVCSNFSGHRSSTNIDTRASTSEGAWSYTTFDSTTCGAPTSGLNNANGLLTFNTHGGCYGHQIAMTSNAALYVRSRNSGSFASWRRIFDDNYHPNADTLTTARTIAGVSFNGSANISLNNNAITNGAGYTTCTGDITAVVAGAGLTGGATSGSATLDVGAGTAITVAADTVSVNSTCNSTWNAKTTCTGTVTNVAGCDGITVNNGTGSASVCVDSTVVRTTGNQSIGGAKTFTGCICVANRIIHTGDSDTCLEFKSNQLCIITGGENVAKFNGGGVVINEPGNSNDFRVESDTDPYALFVDGSANKVGIGCSVPAQKLAVAGDGLFTGDLTVSGGDLQVAGDGILTGDLTVSGGDITLGGTGRIQGIDTVSSGTDAANKTYVDTQVATKTSCTGTTTPSNSQTFTNKSGCISQWTNDSGYTTCTGTGDITAVTAGSGLTGGATSGGATLNVIGGDGITANANDIAVDNTVVRTTGASAPNAPASVTATIVGETVDVTFAASTTSNIDAYIVYSSIDGSDYGLISVVPPEDFASSMSIIDNAFEETGTQAYRVYAVKLGKFSSAATDSISYSVASAEPTSMNVVDLNNAFYVQWNPPSSNARFVTAYNVYKDENAIQGSLSRSNASLVYAGLNTNFMYQINGNNNNNFHQFWVETTIA